jgi:hypothetical protein
MIKSLPKWLDLTKMGDKGARYVGEAPWPFKGTGHAYRIMTFEDVASGKRYNSGISEIYRAFGLKPNSRSGNKDGRYRPKNFIGNNDGGGGGGETDKERADRLEVERVAERAKYEAKLLSQSNKIRKQREAMERQPGNKWECARRENLAVEWLKKLGIVGNRTSPKAPGYDIDAAATAEVDSRFEVGKQYHFEVKPKGELVSEPEEKFAREHQDSWRLIEFDRKTGGFKMFRYDQCVWRTKLETKYRCNPVPSEVPVTA